MPDTSDKILIVSPTPSHPQNQGNRQRIYKVCDHFKKMGFEVHFIWYAIEGGGSLPIDAINNMKAAWDHLHIVPINPNKDIYDKPSKGQGLDQFWDDSISHMIDWCMQNYDYKMMIVNYAVYSKAFDTIQGTNTVGILDTLDVLSNRNELLKNHGASAEFYTLEQAEEKKAILRADIVLGIQKHETAFFRSLGHSRAITLGHSLQRKPPHSNQTTSTFPSPLTIGVIGSNNNVVIENCMKFIAALEKFPCSVIDNIELHIAGSMCDGIFEELPRFVKSLGRISHIDQFYEKLDLVVIPIEFGSGLKTKTIEALSYNLPVMGTLHSFLGIETSYQEHAYESIDDLAKAVLTTVTQEADLSKLQHASEVVFHAYTSKIDDQYDTLLTLADDIRKKKENSWVYLKDVSELAACDSIVFYGAGIGLRYFYKNLSIADKSKIKYIVDSYKAGESFNGIPVISLEELRQKTIHPTIILTLTTSQWKSIYSKLKSMGYDDIRTSHKFLATQFI